MAMPAPDLIAAMTYRELQSLQLIIVDRMQELHSVGLQRLHEEFESKAYDLGYSLEELIAAAKKQKRRPRAHKDNGEATLAE